jgi:predicted kinase
MAETRGRLIIVCGLPGSGKTTLASALAERLGATRYSPDDWMEALSLDIYDESRRASIEALQWQAARELIAQGGTAIIEWGTWARSERDTLRLEARALGAAVELVFLDVPMVVLLERIRRRGLENPPITSETVETWADLFQAPTPDELALFDPSVESLDLP